MTVHFLTSIDLMKIFPDLRPSQLDYLVRDRLVQCERNGKGHSRRFPPEAVEQIRVRMAQRNRDLPLHLTAEEN